MKSKFFIIALFVLTFSTSIMESQAQPAGRNISKAGKNIIDLMKTGKVKPSTIAPSRKPVIPLPPTYILGGSGNSTMVRSSYIPTYPTSAIMGKFVTVYDYYGNPFVVFGGMNMTNQSIYIVIYATNIRGELSTAYNGILSAGESFYFGPAQGWTWLTNYGNKMIVEFGNGQSIYWPF